MCTPHCIETAASQPLPGWWFAGAPLWACVSRMHHLLRKKAFSRSSSRFRAPSCRLPVVAPLTRLCAPAQAWASQHHLLLHSQSLGLLARLAGRQMLQVEKPLQKIQNPYIGFTTSQALTRALQPPQSLLRPYLWPCRAWTPPAPVVSLPTQAGGCDTPCCLPKAPSSAQPLPRVTACW